MWSFDLERQVWSSVIIKSTITPEPRSDFANGKMEENLLMFGGIGDSELLNDFYLFNLRNKEWQLIDIKSEAKPSPRKGSCLASTDSVTYIYGGIVSSGYSSELWKFDWSTNKYELIPTTTSESAPYALAYARCSITYNSEGDEVFELYLGENEKIPIFYLYQFNTVSNEWTSTYVGDYLNIRPKSASIKLGDKIIIAGGYYFKYYVPNIFSIIDTKLESTLFGDLDMPIFSAASVYYKDKLYIHGGGGSYGWVPLEQIIKRDLIVIDLNEDCEAPNECISSCSKGSHKQSGKCEACPKGTYSEVFGSDTCKSCPAGEYSDIKGADSPRVCKRCPDGYFNDFVGQPICQRCLHDIECGSRGISDYSKNSTIEYESQQPEILDEENATNQTISAYFYVGICITFILGVAFISCFKKRISWIKKFDMYSLQHNYEENKPMYIRRTVIGGMFSLAFVCLAISIVFTGSLSYGLNNIIEIKSLVPFITLEQEYGQVITN